MYAREREGGEEQTVREKDKRESHRGRKTGEYKTTTTNANVTSAREKKK